MKVWSASLGTSFTAHKGLKVCWCSWSLFRGRVNTTTLLSTQVRKNLKKLLKWTHKQELPKGTQTNSNNSWRKEGDHYSHVWWYHVIYIHIQLFVVPHFGRSEPFLIIILKYIGVKLTLGSVMKKDGGLDLSRPSRLLIFLMRLLMSGLYLRRIYTHTCAQNQKWKKGRHLFLSVPELSLFLRKFDFVLQSFDGVQVRNCTAGGSTVIKMNGCVTIRLSLICCI